MSRRFISIELDSGELKLLEKRAKQNFMSLRELAQDIIRRSMLSYKKGGSRDSFNTDDALVNVFSREKKGRRRKSPE